MICAGGIFARGMADARFVAWPMFRFKRTITSQAPPMPTRCQRNEKKEFKPARCREGRRVGGPWIWERRAQPSLPNNRFSNRVELRFGSLMPFE